MKEEITSEWQMWAFFIGLIILFGGTGFISGRWSVPIEKRVETRIETKIVEKEISVLTEEKKCEKLGGIFEINESRLVWGVISNKTIPSNVRCYKSEVDLFVNEFK